jgi:hypothetical protein
VAAALYEVSAALRAADADARAAGHTFYGILFGMLALALAALLVAVFA